MEEELIKEFDGYIVTVKCPKCGNILLKYTYNEFGACIVHTRSSCEHYRVSIWTSQAMSEWHDLYMKEMTRSRFAIDCGGEITYILTN